MTSDFALHLTSQLELLPAIPDVHRVHGITLARRHIHAMFRAEDLDAPARLVALLRGEGHSQVGPFCFAAITTGLRCADDDLELLSFAEMCHAIDRPDILRAVYEAGPPQWLKDMRRDDTDKALSMRQKRWRQAQQFERDGFRLPVLKKPSDWMRALETFQVAWDKQPQHRSLYKVASDRLDSRTHPFLELAFQAAPVHQDLDALESSHPVLYAYVRGLRMHQVVQERAATPPAEAPAATPRVARRIGI